MEGFWAFAVIGGPVVLALAMAYAIWQWRHRRLRTGPGDPRYETRVGEPPSRDRYSETGE